MLTRCWKQASQRRSTRNLSLISRFSSDFASVSNVNVLQVEVNDQSEYSKVAKTQARVYNAAGDRIFLYGGLGVGKTAFAREFLRQALNSPRLSVMSPTFTQDITYMHDGKEFHHIDQYRLEKGQDSAGNVSQAGVEVLELDRVFKECITLVEWPQRLHETSHMPNDFIRVSITDPVGEDTEESSPRVISISVPSGCERFVSFANIMKKDLSL